MSNIAFRSKLLILIGVFVAGFILSSLLSFSMLNQVKVNGPIYQGIAQQQDLLADILPPPEYLIESYLVTLQMTTADKTALTALIEKSQSLAKDFEDRHQYWIKELPDGEAKNLLIGKAYKPGKEFLDLQRRQFIPALQRGDAKAIEALRPQMEQKYAEHRAAIDELVKVSTATSNAMEKDATAVIQQKSMLSFAMIAIFLLLGGVVSWWIMRSVMRQLGGEPSEVTAIAARIAGGDHSISIQTRSGDTGSMLFMIKLMVDTLKERAVQLEAVNHELEAFSYSVSHDLRTPLRAIDGFSRILLDDYSDKLDAEGKRLLNVVRDNTSRMGQLIDDMLKFSRAGRLEMSYCAIDMEELAHSVCDELRPTTPGHEVQVEIEHLHATTGDRSMMHQVLVNLLTNAFKFSRLQEVARIKVGSSTAGDEVIYFVQDNGVGFDMQYVDKLFGVFQRLHGVTEFEGTGIGLAIVKRVITRHGGRVWAQGKVNEGATIYFALPN